MSLQSVQSALAGVVAPLNDPVVTVAGVPTSVGEVLGFVTGAACVYAVAKQRVWNWPVGMANNVVFLALFFAYQLYADALLQVVFFALAAYGWWAWVRGGQARTELQVSRTTPLQWAVLVLCGVAGTALAALLLGRYTPSTVPLADGFTTVLSLLATWGQCRKKVESWYVWILADLVYMPLYGYKHLYLTAVLYLGFTALCVVGLVDWRRSLAAQDRPVVTVPVPALAEGVR